MEELKRCVIDSGNKKSFIQVSANWCGPSSLIKDGLERLAREYADSYDFIYCDLEKLSEIRELY